MSTSPFVGATLASDVEAYAAVVRGALADLSAVQRELLVEDLEEHLAEIAAEIDGPLAERLGDPLRYAAELRASAGFDARGMSRRARLHNRVVGVRAELTRRLEAQRGWGPTVAFVRSLRPAWILLRGYLALMLASAVVNDNASGGFFPHLTSHLAGLTGIVAIVVGVYVSFWLDRRQQRGLGRIARCAIVTATVAMVIFAGNWALGVQAFDQAYDASSQSAQAPAMAPAGPMTLPDGQTTSDLVSVTNIYAYGADGQPLDNVRLYDQDGHPIVLADPWAGDPSVIRTHVLQTDGQLSDNAYPLKRELDPVVAAGLTQDEFSFDEAGNPTVFGAPPAASVPPLLLPPPVSSSAATAPSTPGRS